MPLDSPNATIEMLRSALGKLGYTHERFTLDDRAYSRFTAPGGGSWLTRDARISYPMLDATTRQISTDKSLAYELCAKNKVRTPRTITLQEIAPHMTELAVLLSQGPVVVKPSDASLSWGVTLNVRSREGLEMAVEEALQFSAAAIVQQQVSGEEVRFIIVDGQPKAALLRRTARVIGDGKRTLTELIDAENDIRQNLGLMVNYPLLDDNTIDRSAFDMDRVPAKDEMVELNRSTMIRGGASIYNIIDELDEGYKQVAVRAAKAISASFIVVDLMIEDLQAPATETNYAFIEFNSAPVLALCYGCRDGAQYDIVAELVPQIDAIVRERKV